MNPLSPLGWLYGAGAHFRNRLYDKGAFHSENLPGHTISVGNLTTGGTGKTPLVALVARILSECGEKPCVLTRGYGRADPSTRVLVSDGSTVLADAQTGGDEPVELAFKLMGKAAVIADRDRVAAAEWAHANVGATAFVLDDGFQHRRAKRDIDIVCIDATNPFGNGGVLPAGTLRESIWGLSRADVILITRTDLVKDVSTTEADVRRFAGDAEIFLATNKIRSIRELSAFFMRDNEVILNKDDAPHLFAFCGLGNPINFFKQVELEGLDIVGRKAFPDHHYYTTDDIADLAERAETAGAEALITTVKDAVRLRNFAMEMPCYVAEIDTVVEHGDRFREIICPS
jgi:tetraacyldisaccharide 4'-kinase